MHKAAKWADWLASRFVTVDITQAGALASMPRQLAQAPTTTRNAPALRDVAAGGYIPRAISASN
jgi:hypothetical protein